MRKIVLFCFIIASLAFVITITSQDVSSQEEGVVHTVMTGDTLWDISAQYFGDPFRWPEIWEMNRYLTNPNYIYPGLMILIATPPPITEEFKYLLAEKSLPGKESSPEMSAMDKQTEEEIKKKLKMSRKAVIGSGELVRGKPEKVGNIVETTDQKLIFSPGDRLYLNLENDYPLGTEFGVFRVEGPVKVKGIGGKSYKKKYIGKVKIVEKTGNRIIGTITELIEEAFRIDYLSEEIPEIPEVSFRYLDDKLSGGVVVGSGDNYEFAEGDAIYIKGGKEKGFEIGDVVSIYVPLKDLQELTATPSRIKMTEEADLVKVGKAVVIRVNDNFSTIFVIDSRISFNASARVVRENL